MRISPIVLLLLFAMVGCGSGSQPAKPSAKTPAARPPGRYPAAVKKHMTPDQLALGNPIVNSIGMLLVPIPPGQFQMGSPDSDKNARDDEKPQHLVKITKPFYLSVYEVTQQQFEKVMGVRPWQGKANVRDGPDYAATYVTWNDAVEFCRKLSEQEGVEYRLPTEAQWEYACRAGTTTLYSFGDDVSKLGQHAWYQENESSDVSELYAHRVGQKLPNPWGLYDMHGNVAEWCQDWYVGGYGSEYVGGYGSEKAVSDPMGPVQQGIFFRVLRGGSFLMQPVNVRSVSRSTYVCPAPDARAFYSGPGFRPSRNYR